MQAKIAINIGILMSKNHVIYARWVKGMERLKIRISGTMAKARRKSAKVEFFVSTEKISKEKSTATCKAMPNAEVYMIETSALATKRRYITQMTFWYLVI